MDESREARLERVFEQNYTFVWRLLRRFGLPPSDADDAAQETFMVLLRKLDTIEPDRERSYLYGTALRVSRNALRRRASSRSAPLKDGEVLASMALPPDAECVVAQCCSLLDTALRELPERLARVLILSEIEQLALREIAELERIPVGTVSSRLRKGRELVKRKLALRGIEAREVRHA